MFTLLQRPSFPNEFDGKISFCWLPEHCTLTVPSIEQDYFVELRLGYPVHDIDKMMTISGDCCKHDEYIMHLKKGWCSYFIRLEENNRSPCTITISFSHGLQIDGDQRFLGAMLSYAAITDNKTRIEEISFVDKEIIKTLSMYDIYRNKSIWFDSLKNYVENNASEYYTQKSLSAIDAITQQDDVMASIRVEYKKELLISNYINDNSSVLEIGCGKGSMAFLTKRGINLVAIDLSENNCRSSLSRGYSSCHVASAKNMPFPDENFDYVISSDVFGHIAHEYKEQCVKEIFRVLKKTGKTIHFIETDNFDLNVMDPIDFSRMIIVDGHIGIIPANECKELFAKYFQIEKSQLIGNSFMSARHWLRAHDLYGDNLPGEMVAFIQNASQKEIDAFNLGNGIAFWRSFNSGMNNADSGGMLFIACTK